MADKSTLLCFCLGHCPDHESPNGTCVARAGSACFAHLEQVINSDGQYEEEITYGCLPPDESGLMQCKGQLSPHEVPKSIECCDDSDLCNIHLRPVYTQRTPTAPKRGEIFIYEHGYQLVLAITACAFLLVVVFLAFLLLRRYRKKSQSLNYFEESAYLASESSLKAIIDESSGSGSGLPLLVQRTIGKQIEFVKSIGKGRYGEVWKVKWRDEEIAAKVFFTTEEASWKRESQIYQTTLLRHENILGFIASDIRGTGSWTQMILITDYHENGSLHDYLQFHVLDLASALKLAHSAICGICHLHNEIFGKQGKPAIAHRDIKSKNILVARDGRCLIADFGLAVRYDSTTKEIDIAPNTRVGTKRYMAPEVLDETLVTTNFDSYKMADMYSFSLVLWEILRRCSVQNFVSDYQVPYTDNVPCDPDFDDMRNVVCVKGIRPSLSLHWQQCPVVAQVAKMMQECWHGSPQVRLSALRVKKSLSKLRAQLDTKQK